MQIGERDPHGNYRARDAAYAVIFDEQLRVACVTEESGLFLPGGGLEVGEDPVSAVRREVAEECGRALEGLSPLDSAVQFFRTKRGEAIELRASFFLARFAPGHEGAGQLEVRWLPAVPNPPSFYHECHRWAVQQALRRANPAGS